MYQNYLQFAGNEIINLARTKTYAIEAPWMRAEEIDTDGLAAGLGDAPYANVVTDDAPWFEADNPDTADFFGVIPISITGIEDATRSASTVESLGDGGVTSLVRRATKSIVVSVLLAGSTEAAVEAGYNWLSMALEGGCGGDPYSYGGDDLCFLSALGDVDETSVDPTACLDDFRRTMHRVKTVQGPVIMTKAETSDGCWLWSVQWTMVAGTPWQFGRDYTVTDDMMAETAAGLPSTRPPFLFVDQAFNCDQVTGSIDMIRNPAWPAPPTPPTTPNVALSHFAPPEVWRRYSIRVPAEAIPGWADAVPRLVFTAPVGGLTYMRVRFYQDPVELFQVQELDPCGFCGEFVVDYVPPSSQFVIDGSMEQIEVVMPGDIHIPAKSRVFSTDGGPFEWPKVSCGYSYILTLDVPNGQPAPASFAIEMVQRF